jgi:hypothetical protein
LPRASAKGALRRAPSVSRVPRDDAQAERVRRLTPEKRCGLLTRADVQQRGWPLIDNVGAVAAAS